MNSIEDCTNFKLRVLAHTDGKNIHEVNGYLYVIMNSLQLIHNKNVVKNPDDVLRWKNTIDEYTRKLRILLPKANI